MTEPWVCIDCGARQAAKGKCHACGAEDTLDMQDIQVRELMRDCEQRLADQREKRHRLVGVVVGMATVFALWAVPGYWVLQQAMGLPLFFDQWILMALIGFGLMKLLSLRAKKRFPYLRPDLTVG
jgi:hypothetical protein